jgi:carboxyl-terminal processing protease
MTEGGRTVYGGGGITPDEKYEAPKIDRLELELGRNGLFNFARWYFGSHSTSLPKGWMPDAAFLEEFHDYLLKHGTNFTESEFMQDRDWITRYLAREMYITAFNVDESDRIFSQTDPEVAKAVDAMPKASALLETTKKIIVERMNAQQQRSAAAARR